MRVLIAGLGYIGLPTSLLLAENKFEVFGYDIDKIKVRDIANGHLDTKEVKIKKLLKSNLKRKSIIICSKIKIADVYIIAVPTPFNTKKKAELKYVKNALTEISKVLKKGDMIIIESTLPVGTTEKMIIFLKNLRKDIKFPRPDEKHSDVNVAYCPERVLPGDIVNELIKNDRVIGGVSAKCSIKAAKFYGKFINGKCYKTNSRTAELCKISENTYRDVNIAFANELSALCEKLKINPWELIKLSNKHPRVNILEPGPGVGGHCIAIDPWFIINKKLKTPQLIYTARKINKDRPQYIVEKIISEITSKKLSMNKISISLFGLSYKPDIDDIRESPSIEILKKLNKYRFKKIFLVEPNLKKINFRIKSNNYLSNIKEALDNSEIIVILVSHKEFYNLKLKKNQILIDTKNIL